MINFNEVDRLMRIISRSEGDRLLTFVSQMEVEQLDALLQENLQILFKEARKYKVRYLYVGKSEICGCENKRQSVGSWPAMWAIAEKIGFPGSCGNTDQYQCRGAHKVFPSDSFGGWDLKENRKLTDKETAGMKFNLVTSHRWK